MQKGLKENVKKLAINYYINNNVSQEEISDIFGITSRTFRNWYNKYINNNNLDRKKRSTTSYKIKQIHVNFLIKTITNNQSISIHKLTLLLKNKYKNLDISEEHIRRVITDNNITLKRTSKRHYP